MDSSLWDILQQEIQRVIIELKCQLETRDRFVHIITPELLGATRLLKDCKLNHAPMYPFHYQYQWAYHRDNVWTTDRKFCFVHRDKPTLCNCYRLFIVDGMEKYAWKRMPLI